MTWLEELKKGDEVIYRTGGSYSLPEVKVVERTTKTQIVLEDGYKFNKRTGDQVGVSSMWRRPYITEATPATSKRVNEQVEKNNLVRSISNARLSACSLEGLRKVWAILKPKDEVI